MSAARRVRLVRIVREHAGDCRVGGVTMRAMGMTATGVIVRIRATGAEFGMHDVCADDLISQLVAAGYSVTDADMPAVIIGPLFADSGEWTCAHSACKAV